MNTFQLVAAAVAVALAFVQSASAQDEAGTKYVGFSIGQSAYDGYCDGVAICDDDDTGLAVYGGYNFHENFAAEYGFVRHGEAVGRFPQGVPTSGGDGSDMRTSPFTQTHDVRSLFGAGVGKINVNERVTLFGKVGLHYWDVERTVTSSSGAHVTEDNRIHLFYGAGGSVSLPKDKIKLLLEYQFFQIDHAFQDQTVMIGQRLYATSGGDLDIKRWNIGLTYTF